LESELGQVTLRLRRLGEGQGSKKREGNNTVCADKN
jgi:hypothetical protein